MFNDWCNIDEDNCGVQKQLCVLNEKFSGRATIKDELVRRVRSHYDKFERIIQDIKTLGYPKASEILKERMPSTLRMRSAEMGEIIATEFFEFKYNFRIPVRRLQYKDGREMPLRGDDFLGVNRKNGGLLRLLKGESKSIQTVSKGTVKKARQQLSSNGGRPTQISLLFVADRLLEATDRLDRSLGEAIRDEVAQNKAQPQDITHGLFVLSENASNTFLKADLNEADNTHHHISVGFCVKNHQDFITQIFEQAGELEDD